MKINNCIYLAQDIVTKGLPQRQGRISMMSMVFKVSAVVCLGGCSLLPAKTFESPKNDPQSQVIPQNPIAPAPIFSSSSDPNFVVGVVQKVGPAVVRIDSARTVTSQTPEEFEDPFFRRFFGPQKNLKIHFSDDFLAIECHRNLNNG